MARVSKIDQRLHGASDRGGMILFGLPFAAVGTYFVLVGFGLVDPPSRARAPLAIVVTLGAVFALAGLYLIGAGARAMARRLRAARVARNHPDQPWLHEHEWAPGGVVDRPGARAAKASGFAVFLALFLTPFNWWAFWSGAGGLLVVAIVLLFDLVALALVVNAVHHLVVTAKFGRSQLSFRAFPMHPGEIVELGFSPNRGLALETTLRFVEERFVTERRGDGKSHARYEADTLWSEEQRVEPPANAREVPIRYAIPDDGSLTNQMSTGSSVRYWELVVEAHGPGVDFRTTFPLPVYPEAIEVPGRAPVTPLAPRRGRGSGRGFEARLVALALAGAVLVVTLAPDRFSRLSTNALRGVRVQWLLESAGDVGGDAVGIATGPDGGIWLYGTAAVHRVTRDRSDEMERVLEHPVGPQPAFLTSGQVTRSGTLWLGGWDGEVHRFDDGERRMLSSPEDEPKRAVLDLAVFRGDLYAAAGAIWRFPGSEGSAERLAGLGKHLGEVLLADGDRALYAGIARSVWRLNDSGWTRLWRSAGKQEYVGAIAIAPDRILVGTRDGLYALDSAGRERAHGLDGYSIEHIVVDGKRVWVGSDDRGLLHGALAGGVGWRGLDASEGLPDGQLTGVALDGRGRLWLSYIGGVVVHAPSAELEPLLAPR